MQAKKIIHYIREILYIIIIWVLVTLFYLFIKFYDIPDETVSALYELAPATSKKWIYEISLKMALFTGFILGLLHVFVYPLFERTKNRVFKIVFRGLLFTVLSVATILVILYLHSDQPIQNHLNAFTLFRKDLVLNIFIYMFLTEQIIGLFLLLRRSLGGQFFLNMIADTYRNPKEEMRVFMFLDMQDSTPIARQMSHVKFSRYIQDCFLDLSDTVISYGGSIYQFVGDEAVITWKVSSKFDYSECVDLYYAFAQRLHERAAYYSEKYNNQPVFRCAIHSGTISTALVGDYKKEIAYHGNVLNLCARLQAECGRNDAYVMVSEDFYRHIADVGKYNAERIVMDSLKGIDDMQVAYKLEKLMID